MKTLTLTLLAATCLGGGAFAQGMSLGEFEYRNSCAACHGENGMGHGPLAGMLNTSPTDLTALQKTNGGVFPVERLYGSIEGTADVAAHGRRDMPVWGARYRARVDADPEGAFSPEEREAYTRTRILALIEYLSTVQAD